jgi:enoyl-CoA hydratase
LTAEGSPYEPVLVDRTSNSGVTVITLNRPESLNAMNEALLAALERALDQAATDSAVSAVVITGAGRAFCAGNDLREQGVDPMTRVRQMHSLVLRLSEFPKVVVASVSGLALGGGLELAMACTFRTATSNAKFGLPEIKMNLIPGFGGTQLLPRLVGQRRALRMLLSGEPIGADAALDAGLVDVVSDGDPVSAGLSLISEFPGVGLAAHTAVLTAVRQGAGRPLGEALEVEFELVRAISDQPGGQRALEAFRSGQRF